MAKIAEALIWCESKTDFEKLLNAGDVQLESIAFIKEPRTIWTHGNYFPCPENATDIAKTFFTTTTTTTPNWGTSEGTPVRYIDVDGNGMGFRSGVPEPQGHNSKLSLVLDGTVFVNEGLDKVATEKSKLASPHSLKVGTKTYDGSSDVTIDVNDIGAVSNTPIIINKDNALLLQSTANTAIFQVNNGAFDNQKSQDLTILQVGTPLEKWQLVIAGNRLHFRVNDLNSSQVTYPDSFTTVANQSDVDALKKLIEAANLLKSDVINSISSSDSKKPLAASQGKLLYDKLMAMSNDILATLLALEKLRETGTGLYNIRLDMPFKVTLDRKLLEGDELAIFRYTKCYKYHKWTIQNKFSNQDILATSKRRFFNSLIWRVEDSSHVLYKDDKQVSVFDLALQYCVFSRATDGGYASIQCGNSSRKLDLTKDNTQYMKAPLRLGVAVIRWKNKEAGIYEMKSRIASISLNLTNYKTDLVTANSKEEIPIHVMGID